MNLILLFTVLSLVNVIFSTVKSIVTISGGKWLASFLSAGYFSFYNIMLIYTVADFSLVQKCTITFICNLVGVFIVKYIEEKSKKDKLWKVEAVFSGEAKTAIEDSLKTVSLPYNYIEIGRRVLFNVYCNTQKESSLAREIIDRFGGRYFVSESKDLY